MLIQRDMELECQKYRLDGIKTRRSIEDRLSEFYQKASVQFVQSIQQSKETIEKKFENSLIEQQKWLTKTIEQLEKNPKGSYQLLEYIQNRSCFSDYINDLKYLNSKNDFQAIVSRFSLCHYYLNIFSCRKMCTLTELKILTSDQYQQLQALLKKNNRSIVGSRIVYQAKVDGFEAKKFHKLCDKMQNCLLVCLNTVNNKVNIFGAFSSKAFARERQDSDDMTRNLISDRQKSSFIFSLTKKSVHTLKSTISALHYKPDCGPSYGNQNDLTLGDNCHLDGSCQANLGISYNMQKYPAKSAQARRYLGGSQKFKLQNYFFIKLK